MSIPDVFDELPPRGRQQEDSAVTEMLERARQHYGKWVVVATEADSKASAKTVGALKKAKVGKRLGERWDFAARTLFDAEGNPRYVALAQVVIVNQ
jgi:hypothetical protein